MNNSDISNPSEMLPKTWVFDELKIGQSDSFSVTITENMQETFCKLTGDINPMHMTDEYARTRNYENKLVYGMLSASFYSRLVGVYLPGEYCIFQGCDTSFNAPVYIGDELTVYGEIVEKHEGFRRIKIKAYIKNQKGKKVSRATLLVGVDK